MEQLKLSSSRQQQFWHLHNTSEALSLRPASPSTARTTRWIHSSTEHTHYSLVDVKSSALIRSLVVTTAELQSSGCCVSRVETSTHSRSRRHGPTTHHPVLTLPPPVPPSPVCRLHPNMIILTFHHHQVNTGNICHNAIVRVHSTRCPVITRPNNPVSGVVYGVQIRRTLLGLHTRHPEPACVWRWSLD